MPDISELLEKLLPAKVVEKFYDDAASNTAKQVGKIGVDIVKTARLFLAPLQLTAAFQDRFARLVERIAKNIPEERQISAPAEVAGPAIRQMQYLDEVNPLWSMFEELLKCSVDSETVANVHPSFAHLISQLSRDEAIILYRLKDRDFKVVDTLDLDRHKNRFVNRVIEKSDIPEGDLLLPEQVPLYYSHLESLSLVTWPVEKEDYLKNEAGTQTGIRRYSVIKLTEFGRLFASACIPKDGFAGIDNGPA